MPSPISDFNLRLGLDHDISVGFLQLTPFQAGVGAGDRLERNYAALSPTSGLARLRLGDRHVPHSRGPWMSRVRMQASARSEELKNSRRWRNAVAARCAMNHGQWPLTSGDPWSGSQRYPVGTRDNDLPAFFHSPQNWRFKHAKSLRYRCLSPHHSWRTRERDLWCWTRELRVLEILHDTPRCRKHG